MNGRVTRPSWKIDTDTRLLLNLLPQDEARPDDRFIYGYIVYPRRGKFVGLLVAIQCPFRYVLVLSDHDVGISNKNAEPLFEADDFVVIAMDFKWLFI